MGDQCTVMSRVFFCQYMGVGENNYIHWFREKEKRTEREGHWAKTTKS